MKNQSKRFIPTCHHYSLPRHIRPRCSRYLEAVKQCKFSKPPYSARYNTTPRNKVDLKNVRKIWVRKTDLRCHVAYTSLKAVTSNAWYFDSGYSRHMTGTQKYLIDYQCVNEGHVTFEDEIRRKIVGKRNPQREWSTQT